MVVLLDNHFNPSVADQCISRTHRYGQTKDVRVYRLAISGSMEERVYARSVNKAGVATRVVDGIYTEGVFTEDELKDLTRNEIFLCCTKCNKRRLLLDSQDDVDEDNFHCAMNHDTKYNSCSIPESMEVKRAHERSIIQGSHESDPILQHLRGVINALTRKKELVIGCLPVVDAAQDSDICCDQAISSLEQKIADQKEETRKKDMSQQQRVANSQHQGSSSTKKPSVVVARPGDHANHSCQIDSDSDVDVDVRFVKRKLTSSAAKRKFESMDYHD